ncbi:decaprenyl-phosphate phosphoribosyltransferase [bacterium]|nr:decaprenyl-phosphate phosphoribosyltransferase [bacterium]
MFPSLIISMRPQQWIKNLLLFGPLIFSMNLFDVTMVTRTALAFIVFSLAGSAVYLLNDVVDVEKDKAHPVKRNRPIASGKLPIKIALFFMAVIGAGSLVLAWDLSQTLAFIIMIYMVNNLFYSFKLKHIVLIDVGSLSLGFVLRVFAGAAVIGVEASPWLIMCTILLSSFLGFAKRRHELVLLGENNVNHRSVLAHYSPHLLDQLILISAASTVMSYALYTVNAKTVAKFGTTNLIYTVPFILYGVFRYLFLIHNRKKGGDPAKVLLNDAPMVLNIVVWLSVCVYMVYKGGQL